MKKQFSMRIIYTFKRYLLIWVLASCCIPFFATLSHAGAGDLDPTFGDGGLVTTDIGGDYGWGGIGKTLVQSDGKIIAGASTYGFHLLRFNPDGTPDETFGENGGVKVTNPTIAEFNWTISDFALQPDGKILVAGSLRALKGHICYPPGCEEPSSPFPWCECRDVYTHDFLLARFNADGSLDTTFGTNGNVTTDFSDLYGSATGDRLHFIAVQSDGTILGVGTNSWINSDDTYEEHTIIVRYTSEGAQDLSFGVGGIVEFGTRLGNDMTVAQALLMQPDRKFLIQGYSGDYFYSYFLVRYMPDGTVDATFGTDGRIEPLPPGDAIHRQDDGKFLFAGFDCDYDAYPDPICGFSIYRIGEDGSLDMSFGDEGEVITVFGSDPSQLAFASFVAVKPDNKIVAFGELYTYVSPEVRLHDFALAQYNPDGSLDTTFGEGGKVVTEFESRQSTPASMVLQADGKVIAFGNLTTYPVDPNTFPSRNPVMVRYQTNGAIDPSFGSDGTVTVPVHWTSDDEAKDIVAVQGDGKIIVAGKTSRIFDMEDFVLVRYNQDGSVDPSFGEGGTVITDFTFDHEQPCDKIAFSEDEVRAIAIQDDGKILATGQSYLNPYRYGWCPEEAWGLGVARYLPGGQLDDTFGNGGKVLMFGDNQDCAWANDLLVQPDGKIVVAGTMCGNGYLVARFNPDGTPDGSFGNGGIKTIDPGSLPGIGYLAEVSGLALQPDGKLVVAGNLSMGRSGYEHLNRWNLIRFNPDGGLDTTFNPAGGGIVHAFLGRLCSDVTLQPDGNIVVAGSARNPDFGSALTYFTLLRYTPDGSLDPTFGAGGMVQTNFDLSLNQRHANDRARSIALQADGRIVVAGHVDHMYWTSDGRVRSNDDFALVRYNPDGSHDYSFGDGGKVMTEFGSTLDRGEAVIIQADGKILVAGSSSQNFRGLGVEIAIARYEGISTRVDELEGLVVRVQELQSAEILNDGQARSLQAKLQAAIQQVDRGNLGAAKNQLGAFVNHVDAFVSDGILSPEEGLMLNDEAQMIIQMLST